MGAVQTPAIQRAIDACAEAGRRYGWRFQQGVYLSGTLVLRSHVTPAPGQRRGAQGQPARREDYPAVGGSFVDAVGQQRNRCTDLCRTRGRTPLSRGWGTIDGNGGAFGYEEDGRPFMIRFVDCTRVRGSRT